MDITSLTGITSDYIEKVAEQNRLVNTSDDSFQIGRASCRERV